MHLQSGSIRFAVASEEHLYTRMCEFSWAWPDYRVWSGSRVTSLYQDLFWSVIVVKSLCYIYRLHGNNAVYHNISALNKRYCYPPLAGPTSYVPISYVHGLVPPAMYMAWFHQLCTHHLCTRTGPTSYVYGLVHFTS